MGKPAATDRPPLLSLSHSFTLDFVVLCNGTKAEALAMKEELRGLLDTMGLTLSEEKTKVTHITEGYVFLGYQTIREIGTQGKMTPKVLIPESASKKFSHTIRRILAPRTANEALSAKILALNQLTRGWCEYYRSTSAPSPVFRRLSNELYWLMTHWLGRKYKLSIPEVLQKYWIGNAFSTKSTRLIMPNEYKARRRLLKRWHNPYTEKEEIVRERIIWYESLWTGTENRQGWSDIREEVIALKGTTCHICGKELHESEVEVHHTKPRARFKDKTEADRMKHLQPTCTSAIPHHSRVIE